jgi:hypothetical protein
VNSTAISINEMAQVTCAPQQFIKEHDHGKQEFGRSSKDHHGLR